MDQNDKKLKGSQILIHSDQLAMVKMVQMIVLVPTIVVLGDKIFCPWGHYIVFLGWNLLSSDPDCTLLGAKSSPARTRVFWPEGQNSTSPCSVLRDKIFYR